MNKLLLFVLLSSPLLASDYYLKPNGVMVFKRHGAKVPERKQQDPQVLNPEFIDLPPIQEKDELEVVIEEKKTEIPK